MFCVDCSTYSVLGEPLQSSSCVLKNEKPQLWCLIILEGWFRVRWAGRVRNEMHTKWFLWNSVVKRLRGWLWSKYDGGRTNQLRKRGLQFIWRGVGLFCCKESGNKHSASLEQSVMCPLPRLFYYKYWSIFNKLCIQTKKEFVTFSKRIVVASCLLQSVHTLSVCRAVSRMAVKPHTVQREFLFAHTWAVYRGWLCIPLLGQTVQKTAFANSVFFAIRSPYI
jgi:hypothetical protein